METFRLVDVVCLVLLKMHKCEWIICLPPQTLKMRVWIVFILCLAGHAMAAPVSDPVCVRVCLCCLRPSSRVISCLSPLLFVIASCVNVSFPACLPLCARMSVCVCTWACQIFMRTSCVYLRVCLSKCVVIAHLWRLNVCFISKISPWVDTRVRSCACSYSG